MNGRRYAVCSCGKKGVDRAAGARRSIRGERGVWGVCGVGLRDGMSPSSRCSVRKTRVQRCFQISSDKRGPGSSIASNGCRAGLCGAGVFTKYSMRPAELGKAYSLAIAPNCACSVECTGTSVPRRNCVWYPGVFGGGTVSISSSVLESCGKCNGGTT